MQKYLVLSFLTLAQSVSAGTYQVPGDQPVATFRIPDKWPTQQHEEFVEATAPNGAGHVLILPVEGSKVTESMGEAMRYLRRNGTIRVKADSVKEERAKLKGAELRVVSWDSTNNNEAIKIRCQVVSVIDRKRLLIVFWGSREVENKYRKELTTILESVQPP
jgi:hypothetical protein